MLSFDEVNILGQLTNSTWGSASTERGNFPVGTSPLHSLKAQIVGSASPNSEHEEGGPPLKLIVRYTEIVGFRSDQELQAEKRRCDVRAKKLIDGWIKNVKSEFKLRASRALKVKEAENVSSCEIIYTGSPQLSFYTQQQRPNFYRAYHRTVSVFNIS